MIIKLTICFILVFITGCTTHTDYPVKTKQAIRGYYDCVEKKSLDAVKNNLSKFDTVATVKEICKNKKAAVIEEIKEVSTSEKALYEYSYSLDSSEDFNIEKAYFRSLCNLWDSNATKPDECD
ncbi:hypothetical protein N9A28_02170 [Sulfurimonas sp.]|nr:hypothetical protein [Sulfurimonas sp.]